MSILVVLVLVLLSTLAPRLGTELRATTPARRDRLITLSRRVGRPCARGPPARPIGFDRDGRRHEPHRLHHLRRHHAECASPTPPKHQHLSHRAVVVAAVPTRRVSPAALPRAQAWETRCPSAWRSAVRRSGDQLSVYEEILLSLDKGHLPCERRHSFDKEAIEPHVPRRRSPHRPCQRQHPQGHPGRRRHWAIATPAELAGPTLARACSGANGCWSTARGRNRAPPFARALALSCNSRRTGQCAVPVAFASRAS